jgi:hypothetical protein
MALKTYTTRDGILRLYDGTATPFYIEIPFVQANFTAPLGRPRPDEIAVMNRGRFSVTGAPNWHYISGADDAIIQPLNLSFSFRLGNTEPSYQKFRDALNIDMITAPWTVGASTWVTTKGKSSLLSGGETPTLVTTPLFADARKRCVDVQVMYTDPDGALDIGVRWREVYFPPDQQTVNEGDDMVDIRCTGLIYGDIAEITAFTAGTLS